MPTIKLPLLFLLVLFQADEENLKKVVLVQTPESYQLLDAIENKQNLKEPFVQILQLKNTPLRIYLLEKLAFQALRTNSPHFVEFNNAFATAAIKIGDIDGLGISDWNKAEYFFEKYNYKKAYGYFQKAKNSFEKTNYTHYIGKMLYNMAYIKGHFKNTTSTEILTHRAIREFKAAKNIRSLILAYAQLSNLNEKMGDYKKALEYNRKALVLLEVNPQKGVYHQGLLNNMGYIHLSKGEYTTARDYFINGLTMDSTIKTKSPRLYAQLLDNRAFSAFKINNSANIVKDLEMALRIRDSIKHVDGQIINRIHLSEVLFHQGQNQRALAMLKQAHALANQIKSMADYLSTLKTLSEVDSKNAVSYLQQHVFINDSILHAEQEYREQFIRLDFESSKNKEENINLKSKNVSYLLLAVICLTGLFFLIIHHKQKNKKQQTDFRNKLMNINEELFFMANNQQIKFEEGINQERNRVSEELHDSALSKLFGIRLGMGFLKLSDNKIMCNYLQELQNIETEIREISHNLKNSMLPSEITLNVFSKLVEEKCHLVGITPHIKISENVNWKQFDEVVKIQLYRILQEGLQNILKYSTAKNATLTISENLDTTTLSIKDDGVGFNTNKVHKGIGLKNITSRVRDINGTFNITSAPGQGTELNIQF